MNHSRSLSLRHIASTIFALSAILPLLLFLHALWRFQIIDETEAQIGLFLALGIALLGFVLFQRTVHRISAVVQAFRPPDVGVAGSATVDLQGALVAGVGPVTEVAHMAEAFRRLLEDLRVSTERLQDLVFKLGTLNELVEMAGRIPKMQDLLGVVLERTMRGVGATIGSIMLLDREVQTLRVVAARGPHEESLTGVTVKVGEGIAGKVAALGEPVLVRDIETDPRFARANDPKYGSGSFICLPIRVADRMIGVVNLAKKDYGAVSADPNPPAFSQTDLQFLNALMTYIGYAVDNARLIEEARESATRLQKVVEDQQLRLTLAQQQMLQSAKLSAVGQLVAGVAHELNNPLMVVLGFGQLVKDQAPEALRRPLEHIYEAAEQARSIVHGLLTFARQQPLEHRAVDPAALLEKVLRVTGADLQFARVTVETDIAPDLPCFWADEGQLQQVLVNLITNARQAMAEIDGERRLRIVMKQAATDRVQILVADTGPGIRAELLSRIFDPFVTTKGAHGTGLGLSISYGIVQEHEGQLSVESTPGRGATFTIELPIRTRPADSARATDVSPSLAGRRIVVVEDDPRVQSLACAYLDAAGYTTVGVLSAEEALTRLDDRADLVLSDLYLPGIDGFALYHEAIVWHPRLRERFVMMTGAIVTETVQEALEETGVKLLAKPFSREQLLDVVSEALRGSVPRAVPRVASSAAVIAHFGKNP